MIFNKSYSLSVRKEASPSVTIILELLGSESLIEASMLISLIISRVNPFDNIL